MEASGIGWALQTIIGGAILAAVLFWVMLRNKKSSQADIDRTEDATRELYREEEAARDHEDDRGP